MTSEPRRNFLIWLIESTLEHSIWDWNPFIRDSINSFNLFDAKRKTIHLILFTLFHKTGFFYKIKLKMFADGNKNGASLEWVTLNLNQRFSSHREGIKARQLLKYYPPASWGCRNPRSAIHELPQSMSSWIAAAKFEGSCRNPWAAIHKPQSMRTLGKHLGSRGLRWCRKRRLCAAIRGLLYGPPSHYI